MAFMPDRSEVIPRHILERYAREQPNKECIVFEGGERWTYGEALLEGYRAANIFAAAGIKRGEPVLIFMPNGSDWVRTWWGVSFLGALIVPVNTAYKGEMLKHICRESSAKYIVTTPELAKRLTDLGLNLNIMLPGLLDRGSVEEAKLSEPIEPWDVHGIMFTSGTTGPSKGVISHYLRSYNVYKFFLRAGREDTVLVDLPMFHASGMYLLVAALAAGARVAMLSGFSRSHYWDIIREYGVTCSLMVGPMASFLLSEPPRADDTDHSLRRVGMAPIVDDLEGFKIRFGVREITVSYASTEVAGPIMMEPNGTVSDPKCCGKKRHGVEVRLVDEYDIPVAPGESGELIIRSDLPWEFSTGYWGHPEETAKAWRNGWFHTGDLMRMDSDGYYYLVDRKKDAIRRRGENISSFEVEREVLGYPGIAEAACVAAPGDGGEDEVKVFIVLHNGASFDPAGLIEFLIPRMPYFMVPRFIEVVDELPKTVTMRVQKFKLRDRGNSERTWDREVVGIVVKRERIERF